MRDMLRAVIDARVLRRIRGLSLCTMLVALAPGSALAQVKAQVAPGITPVWDKGIQPISRDNYWNAVECGKQGGERPACVFYDADFCKNDDFVIALFTPYKLVAYETWQATRKRQEPLATSYGDAQKTRITVGITPRRDRRTSSPRSRLRARGASQNRPLKRSKRPADGSSSTSPRSRPPATSPSSWQAPAGRSAAWSRNQCWRGCADARRAAAVAASIPDTRTHFWRERPPAAMDTARFGTASALAITSISSSFAAPSTGGACRRTRSAFPRIPATPDFPARGITRTVMRTAVASGAGLIADAFSASVRR